MPETQGSPSNLRRSSRRRRAPVHLAQNWSPRRSSSQDRAATAERPFSASAAAGARRRSQTEAEPAQQDGHGVVKGPVRPPPPFSLRVREQDEVRIVCVEAALNSAGNAKANAALEDDNEDEEVRHAPVGEMRLPRKKRAHTEPTEHVADGSGGVDVAWNFGVGMMCGGWGNQASNCSSAVAAELAAVTEELHDVRRRSQKVGTTRGGEGGALVGSFGVPKIRFRGGASAAVALLEQRKQKEMAADRFVKSAAAAATAAGAAGADTLRAHASGNVTQRTAQEGDAERSADSAGGAGPGSGEVEAGITKWPSLRFLQMPAKSGRCFGLASSIAATKSVCGFVEIPIGVRMEWAEATSGDEFFVVELGKARLDVSNGDHFEVRSGDHVVVPLGSYYCFENSGERPCRMAWFVPGGRKGGTGVESFGFEDGDGVGGGSDRRKDVGVADVQDQQLNRDVKELGKRAESNGDGNPDKVRESGDRRTNKQCKSDLGCGEGVENCDNDEGQEKLVMKADAASSASGGVSREPDTTRANWSAAAQTGSSAKPPVDDGSTSLKPLVCDICGWAFRKRGNLRKHIRTVHGERNRDYSCDKCGACFLERHNRDSHAKLVCGGAKPFSCSVCGSKFGRKSSMRQHERTVHEKQRPWVCSFCGQAFGQKSTLAKHIKAVCGLSSGQDMAVCDGRQPHSSTAGSEGTAPMHASSGLRPITAEPTAPVAPSGISPRRTASKPSAPPSSPAHVGGEPTSTPAFATKPEILEASLVVGKPEEGSPLPLYPCSRTVAAKASDRASKCTRPLEEHKRDPDDSTAAVPSGKHGAPLSSLGPFDDGVASPLKRRKLEAAVSIVGS